MVAVVSPATGQVIPFSCSTHLANDVTEQLRHAKLGSRALEFCLYLHRQTFGNAGWHRKLGREEWWCPFDLVTWAGALACNKSNVRRIRADLEACQIILFEPDPAHPGQGRIGWNLAFAEWQPYDGRRVDRARRPRMIPEKQARVVILQQQEHVVICQSEQAGVVTESDMRHGASGSRGQEGVVISHAGLQASPMSKQPRQLDEKQCKITMFASDEMAQRPAQATPVRKGLRKKATETPDVVSEGTSPSPETLSGPVAQLGAPTVAPAADGPPGASSGGDRGTMERMPPTPVPPNREDFWPPRQAWERTDLDHYQRVLREREKERVALLTRLAHERIGIPLETASYARIGVLAKQSGAALLVKHILLAAATHIDGDPLDYLTKLAHSQHAGQSRKKEASYGTAYPHSGPSSSETPRRSGWDGWDVATAR